MLQVVYSINLPQRAPCSEQLHSGRALLSSLHEQLAVVAAKRIPVERDRAQGGKQLKAWNFRSDNRIEEAIEARTLRLVTCNYPLYCSDTMLLLLSFPTQVACPGPTNANTNRESYR